MKSAALFLSLFLFIISALPAQTSASGATDPAMTSTHFDMTGFPQWSRDLRRAEIVAFGSFPFMYFFANFGVDTYRYATHGGDRRYAPWPLKPAGAVEQTQDQKIKVLMLAAGGSVLVSIVDYAIVRYKRNREEKEIRNLPPGTPIIIRKPLDGEDRGARDAEPSVPSGGVFPGENSVPLNTGTDVP